MRELFKEILEAIDSRLPSYFLVKGGRLEVAPLSAKEYANLIANGYQPIVEVQYEQLDKEVLEAGEDKEVKEDKRQRRRKE
jgi:hypothetical protein